MSIRKLRIAVKDAAYYLKNAFKDMGKGYGTAAKTAQRVFEEVCYGGGSYYAIDATNTWLVVRLAWKLKHSKAKMSAELRELCGKLHERAVELDALKKKGRWADV